MTSVKKQTTIAQWLKIIHKSLIIHIDGKKESVEEWDFLNDFQTLWTFAKPLN